MYGGYKHREHLNLKRTKKAYFSRQSGETVEIPGIYKDDRNLGVLNTNKT